MNSNLHWMRMNDIKHAAAERVVLRVTHGDSEFVDCSNKKYKLVIKAEPWEDPADFSDALSIIDGQIPNEATWLGENNEPGRIVFDLTKKDTDLNISKSSYYCRIIETAADGKSEMRPAFMGRFRVTLNGDSYEGIGGEYGE